MGKLSLFASLSHSLCLSASLSHSPRWLETMAKGIVARNTELEDYSLFPSTADVICVPLNCCILCGSNLQSYCVKHAPWLLRDCCWQALHIRLKKKKFTCHLFWVDWVLSTKYEKLQHFPATLYMCLYFFFRLSTLVLHMMRLLLLPTLITWFLLAFSWSWEAVCAFLALKCVVVIRNGPPLLRN